MSSSALAKTGILLAKHVLIWFKSRYDNYLDDDEQEANTKPRQSGYGDLGMGFLNGEMDDDDDSDDETLACPPDAKHNMKVIDEKKAPSPPLPAALLPSGGIQIVAPKPGYAAQVGALHDNLKSPEPVLQRPNPQMQQGIPAALARGMPPPIDANFSGPGSPGLATPRPAFMPPIVPGTPHPLPHNSPITPQFVMAPSRNEKSDVKFSSDAIMRGKSEETLLPRRGEKGDDFWRRFSMVVKVEDNKRGQSR